MGFDAPPDQRSAARASWKAVAWLEGLTLLGICLVIGAVFSTFCFMCGESEPMSAGAKLALWTGIAALVGAPILAARTSGWPLWPIVGIVAAFAGAGGFVLGVALFGDLASALVVGLGVEGAVAVRPRSRAAVVARVVVVGTAAALGGDLDSAGGAMGALVLLTLPAIAFADTLVSAAADSPSTRPQHPPSPS